MSTLLEYLARTVAANPDHPAIAEPTGIVSYAELDSYAETLAAQLQDYGAGPGERVAIKLPAGADLAIAVWAVLKSGAAYVPLDPASPPARLDLMLRRIRPKVAIVADSWPDRAIPTVDVVAARGDRRRSAAVAVTPDDPAYVLHTSGSTGVPKGVVLTHRNATAFVDWAVAEFDIGAADRIAGHAPAYFDLSVLDIFGAAKAGATLLPIPAPVRMFGAELANYLRQTGATVLYCVPTALTMLSRAARAEQLTSLRCVLFAGEVCPPATLHAMFELAPHARFANLFGPTETNVCTYYSVSPTDLRQGSLPIGRPIPGVQTTVMAGPDREAAIGEPGELYVAGPTVANGYWDDPAQTRARFVRTPIGRAYRTGDTVVRSRDGLLYYRGRRDRQIKTRGHRVELDEIEAVLRADPAVVEVAVIAVPDESITHRITAVLTVRGATTTAELRQVCAARLPNYAIPAEFRIVDELPLTPTGKLDRTALAAQARSASTSR